MLFAVQVQEVRDPVDLNCGFSDYDIPVGNIRAGRHSLDLAYCPIASGDRFGKSMRNFISRAAFQGVRV